MSTHATPRKRMIDFWVHFIATPYPPSLTPCSPLTRANSQFIPSLLMCKVAVKSSSWFSFSLFLRYRTYTLLYLSYLGFSRLPTELCYRKEDGGESGYALMRRAGYRCTLAIPADFAITILNTIVEIIAKRFEAAWRHFSFVHG